MKALIRIAVGMTLAALLAACAPTYHYPGPTTPPAQPAPPPEPRPQPQPEPERRLPPQTIQPDDEADTPPARSSAIDSLLEQGWTQYQSRNYEGALSVAERAQRIDARNPEVYLLMARAKLALYQTAAAEQLARRGLSLSRAGTSVYRDLQALLAQIAQQ